MQQQHQASLQSNNNQLKEKINLVSPAILTMQQSPNAMQIGQLRKLGNANLQINKGGGGIQMKHGNLLGMQAAAATVQSINEEQKQMMMMNTQRVHAAANTGNSIEFCAEMIAPSSTKSFPTTGKKVMASTQGNQMQIQISSQNTLGSGRRAQGGNEEAHMPSAKKKQGGLPQSNLQQQSMNLQYQSATLSNQQPLSSSHLQQNLLQPQFKSKKLQPASTTHASHQQTQQKNQMMLAAAAQNSQSVSGTVQKKSKNAVQPSSTNNMGGSSFGSNQMNNIQFANNATSQDNKMMKRQNFSKNGNDHSATRDNSSNSEKLNNSLLKLKSRNRCNENLKAGGVGGGPIEKQSSFPKKIISNKDSSNQGQDIIQNQISNSSYQEQQQKLNLSQEYIVNPLLNTAPALALASLQTMNSSQKQLIGHENGSSILNTLEQQFSSDKFIQASSSNMPSSTSKSLTFNQRNNKQKQVRGIQEQLAQNNFAITSQNVLVSQNENTDGQSGSIERAQTIGSKQAQRGPILPHNKGSLPPQLDTSQDIFKLGNFGLQNMKKFGMPLTQTNKEQKQEKAVVLKNYQQPLHPGVKNVQIQNNSIAAYTSQIKATEDNFSKSPSANPRGTKQQIVKGGVNLQMNSDQGLLLNSERAGLQGSCKLSLSHEFPSSARECEMSTTINCTAGNLMIGTTAMMEGATSQTMVISNADNSSIMGNSPHNQTLAVPKSGASGSSILQRRAAGSSQHIVSQLAPSQAKRRHYLKTGSVNTQRLTTEENVHSSPSTGGNGMGPQNNASNSIGNKSQHYGLSSQSFLTNSNNSGSQPRDNLPTNSTVVVPGPSSARLNSSSLGTSFYNHQRQKSGGFFQQILSGGAPSNNNGQHASKSNTSQLNTSTGAAASGNVQTVILKKSSQIISANPKQVVFGNQDSSSGIQETSHHSIKATLSGSSLNQAKMMAQSTQIMHNSIQQKLSLSSRQQYNPSQKQLQQNQQPVITSGNVMLKNKSKTSFIGKSSEGGPSSSSRSNSIKKRQVLNQKQPTTSSKKNEGVKRNNYMMTSSGGVVDDDEEPPSPINNLDTNKSMLSNQGGGGGASFKNSMRKSLQQINRQQYNHTVEEVGADLQNTSNNSFLNQEGSNLLKQQQQHLQIFQQLSFSNDPSANNIQTTGDVPLKKDLNKKNVAGTGMNRSVIVEPSQLIVSSRAVGGGQGKKAPMNHLQSDHKNSQIAGNNGAERGMQEFEMMKNELKSKDMLIQNLRDRLQNLEEKVNGIQITQQVAATGVRARNNRTTQEERGASTTSSDRARDKSQQRIKEAILNLERKLEQFRQDKDLNHLRLEEMKQQYSSSQHSSSRQSEQQLQLQNQKSLQLHLQTMIEAGLLHSPQAFSNRPQTYLMTSSSNEGGGFATHTLGGPPRRQTMKSTNSLIEDLESLTTIGEQQNNQEALAAAVIQRDLGVAHYYLEDFVGDGGGHLPIFYDNGGLLLSSNHNTNKRQPLNKIKTPMFENPVTKNNLLGSLNDEDDDGVEGDLQLFIEQNEKGNQLHGQQESCEEDNSCLLMLEKEWQEAQHQKILEEQMMVMQKGKNTNKNTNMSQLFDQSLIIATSNHHNQMQNQVNQSLGAARNNLTQNNIVFFFDEDTTLEEEDVDQLPVGEAEEIALTAQVGREKFVKTQKIEFSQIDRNSLGLNFPRRAAAGAANGNNYNSLSPSSSDNAQRIQFGGGGPIQLHKPSLNVFSSNKQGLTSSSTTNQAIQIQTQLASHHNLNQQQVVQSQNHQQPPGQTFSRTLSKTTLLAKIRNAIGKSNNTADQGANTIATVVSGGVAKKKIGATGASPKKAQPRRFIVKRSQERNASTSNNPVIYNQIKATNNHQVIAIQPLKLKTKVTATSGAAVRSIQEEITEQQKSIQIAGGEFHQQQESLMKTIVQQKEKIALTQKDAIKKERELSLKLRQAIQKLNMKIQIQQTNPGQHNSGGVGTINVPHNSTAVGGSATKKSTASHNNATVNK